MTLDEFTTEARRIGEEARDILGAADPGERLDAVKGRLNAAIADRLTALQRALGKLPHDNRRDAGQAFNHLKTAVIDPALAEFQQRQAAAKGAGERVDLSLPAREAWRGARHPVTQVVDEIVGIFRELGFTVAAGPEAETPWYNFGSLNFPADHPAMELHDTLYLGQDALLRTHTSPVQTRTLQRFEPPVRVLIPGNVYRRDFFDPSHAPAFMQIEGLAVDEGISFVDLKSTLSEFARRFFGSAVTRFRPSFFPFTEPSAEMDVQCLLCGGSGCAGCKGTGWMEILGSGMVHPAVLEAAGVDSERYTGWAFGMGPGRIAMLRFGLPDIRLLYDSDVRFLEQFA
ncbi:Phenylalanyl-tRNA synthetase alpha chain [Gemmatirosa kalamazoonensis]|uniref:Phenylalanine--tRNA ligase alpha subunit n=1 Tax=Gemmatirosa kalamazoonensis TaxID=861299 RepID=W0RKL6_9BACT|nr:phenylalanine--tRNA ligase subunit alpha [Gemmatirosa kalamazoonensis]AHG90982.1 Phenylalanyl-tRNA synthetase alpha chain [Gemmatirosa kalamazoonensis]